MNALIRLQINKTRRGIHGLVAVCLMIGFSIAGAGLLLGVFSEYASVVSNNHACLLDGIIYDTGENKAFFVISLYNLGSRDIILVNVTFTDSNGNLVSFSNDSLLIASGDTWEKRDSIVASINENNYTMHALAVADDGSVVSCGI